MDINSNYSASTNSESLSLSSAISSNTTNNSNSSFGNGSSVTAEIVDITKDETTIKLENGQTLTGTLQNSGNAKIGDTAEFTVSRDNNNNLNFSISKDSNAQVENTQIKNILQSYGFKGTKEQVDIGKLLTKNSFALTKDNFVKLNQAVNLLGRENLDKAVFMLKNNIDVNSNNANLLSGFEENNNSLSANLKNLSTLISNMPEGNVKSDILSNLFPEGLPSTSQDNTYSSEVPINQFFDKLSDLKNNEISQVSQKDISNLLKDLPMSKDILEDISKNLSSKFPEFQDDFKSSINTRTKLLDLIDNNKEFIGKELLTDKNPNILDKFMQTVKTLADNENINLKNISFSDKELANLSNKLIENTKNSLEFKLTEKFSLSLDDIENKNIDSKLNEIKSNLEFIKNTISSSDLQNNDIKDTLSNIENSTKFLSNLKTEIFMQVPIMINNENLNSEIFVFKDNKKSANIKRGASALVALDTANIGRYEVYLTKNGENIHCQFRLDNKYIEGLTLENMEKLKNALKSKSLNLEGYAFAQNNGKFSLGNLEPFSPLKESEKSTKSSLTGFDCRM